ncbi:MAG: riboflavin biosynthesis protein RibF [Oscillospiraceae bacterium]|nr:riboflavin biosynthesis protein RibF [Oscillospiraceae bacterium]
MNNKPYCLALGFFDGVHIGHGALLRRVKEVAAEKGLTPGVITFDSHPLSMVTGKTVPLINSPADRAGIIRREYGIDDVIFLHFDSRTMHMPWDAFIVNLKNEFDAAHLVAGHDFHFGDKGAGNPELLQQKCAELGLGCDIIAPVTLDGVLSSSTHIRKLLEQGEIERANAFLGHPHVLTDHVRTGYKLGRTLGAPTINMCFEPGVLIPRRGVYATRVYLPDGSEHAGVTNIGVRPTVDTSTAAVTAETFILDYQGNLYGQTVRIAFYKLLRQEIKFESVEALKAQIQRDAQSVRAFFAAT